MHLITAIQYALKLNTKFSDLKLKSRWQTIMAFNCIAFINFSEKYRPQPTLDNPLKACLKTPWLHLVKPGQWPGTSAWLMDWIDKPAKTTWPLFHRKGNYSLPQSPSSRPHKVKSLLKCIRIIHLWWLIYVSTWLGCRAPGYLVKHHSGWVCEGVWMSSIFALVDWVGSAIPVWVGLSQWTEGLNRTKRVTSASSKKGIPPEPALNWGSAFSCLWL